MSASQPTIDEALVWGVGEFGWGQRFIFLQVGLGWIPVAMHTYLAALSSVDVGRQVADCKSAEDAACRATIQRGTSDLCSLPRDAWRWRRETQSTSSEWDLHCGHAWRAQMPNIAFFIGHTIGTALVAELAEAIGRRKALMVATALTVLAGGGCALAGDVWWYMLMRALTGMGAAGMAHAAQLLALDPVGPSWRSWAAVLLHVSSAVGGVLVSLLAWLVPGWRLLTLLSVLVTLIFFLMTPSLPESAQWLLAIGRKGEATAALAEIASRNKAHLPEAPLQDAASGPPIRPLGDILTNARLRRRLALLLTLWPLSWLLFLGMTFLVAARLPGRAPINLLLCFAVDGAAVAAAAPLMERLGRCSVCAAMLMLGGGASLLCAICGGWLLHLAATAGQVGAAVAVSLLYGCTTELFPTSVRAAAMHACTLAGNMGTVLAPGIVILATLVHAQFVPWLPLGGAGLVAAAAAMALPETLGLPISDTIQDMAPPVPRRSRLQMLPLHQIFKTKSNNAQLHGYFMRLSDAAASGVS